MRQLEFNFGAMALYYNYTEMHPKGSGFSLEVTRQDVRKYNCIIKRPHWLYVNLAVRRDYSSPGRMGSTSTLPCAATTRLRPHALYVDLVVRREYSSPAARALRQPRRAPRVLVITLPAAAIYLDFAARPSSSDIIRPKNTVANLNHQSMINMKTID
jgi:hypothetical protein